MKSPTVRYLPDYKCNSCSKEFDLDIGRASLISEETLMVNNPRDASGDLRSNKRWAPYNPIEKNVKCPWCSKIIMVGALNTVKKEKKKVPLAVHLCPHCSSVWQYRGTLPDETTCPICSKSYSPHKGNISEKGSFICPSCGIKDKVINSIRKLPGDQLLPTSLYAIEGYCPECAGDGGLQGFGHFVIIIGLEQNVIYYHDPDMGIELAKDVQLFFTAWEKFSLKGVTIWKSTKK